MEIPSSSEATRLLKSWQDGDCRALDQLIPIIYDELHRLAVHYLSRERGDHTLQATALIHETYLRLIDQQGVEWQSRAHFIGVAAQMMRRVLVDHARARCRAKRGGGLQKVSLDEALTVTEDRNENLVALDEALTLLATIDERKGRVVELRYFGGLSVEETAEVLRVSEVTIMRDWKLAKAWLYDRVSEAGE